MSATTTTTPPPAPTPAVPAPVTSGWGATVISVTGMAIYLAAIGVAYLKGNDTLLTALCGVAATNATTIVGFWVGSSSGSQKKDDNLAIAAAAGLPVAPKLAVPPIAVP